MDKKSNNLELIRERIIYFADNSGDTRSDFLLKTGLKKGIFDYKDIDRAVGSDKLSNILDIYSSLNPDWLITGRGEMLKSKFPLPESTDSGQDIIDGVLIPVYNSEASAGGGALTLSSEFVVDKIKVPFAREGDSALTIVGNSMTPILNSGDLVVVRQLINWREYIEYGKIFIIVTIDEVFCKVVHKSNEQNCFTLHSYNNSYDDFDVPLKFINNMYKVVGVVSQRSF